MPTASFGWRILLFYCPIGALFQNSSVTATILDPLIHNYRLSQITENPYRMKDYRREGEQRSKKKTPDILH